MVACMSLRQGIRLLQTIGSTNFVVLSCQLQKFWLARGNRILKLSTWLFLAAPVAQGPGQVGICL